MLLKPVLLSVFLVSLLASCSRNYYVVRHAEKADPAAVMSSDVPLSEQGMERAERLASLLSSKQIKQIFSTNTIRTKSTAAPLSEQKSIPIQIYGPAPTAFIEQLKQLRGNTLIVGHSNTVDDLVNGLAGSKQISGDLDESEYDNLFKIRYGGFLSKRVKFTREKY